MNLTKKDVNLEFSLVFLGTMILKKSLLFGDISNNSTTLLGFSFFFQFCDVVEVTNIHKMIYQDLVTY